MRRTKLTLQYLRRHTNWSYAEREAFRRAYPAGIYEDKCPGFSLKGAAVTLVPIPAPRQEVTPDADPPPNRA